VKSPPMPLLVTGVVANVGGGSVSDVLVCSTSSGRDVSDVDVVDVVGRDVSDREKKKKNFRWEVSAASGLPTPVVVVADVGGRCRCCQGGALLLIGIKK
jgi:hypothetical protein